MRTGFVGSVGRWCFRHWAWVLLIWAGAVGAGVLSSGAVFDRLAVDSVPGHIESIEAYDVAAAGNPDGSIVYGLVNDVDPGAAPIAAAVTDLRALPRVRRVESLPAADRRAALIGVQLEADSFDDAFPRVEDRLRALGSQLPPGATVEVGGNAVLQNAARHAVQADLSRAELISLPVTLVVLFIVFGGLVAAGLPVLAAAVSVAAAMTVLLGFTTFTDVDQNGVTVVTLLGLGLSVDYGLLLVARYREELAAGREPVDAVTAAWATAGRTIMFSGLTVAAALAGLLVFDVAQLAALGAAGISIAIVAMLTALTFTAGLLGMLRRWIRPSARTRRRIMTRLPGNARVAEPLREESANGFFAGLAAMVQRRPLTVAVATGTVLIAAGLPLLSTSLRLPRLEGIPNSIEAKRVAVALDTRFGRPARPAVTVVARTDPASLDAWAARWRTDPAVARVRPARPAGPGVSTVDIDTVGGTQDPAARALVHRIRADRPPGVASWVAGDAAILVDLLGLIGARLPYGIAITVLGMVALLFAMTGSLVVPVKAVLANIVSLGATVGVMTAVFGHGVAAGLLHTLTVGGLDPFVLVIVFGFAFGLSMDYEVFLLARIKEYRDRGWDTDAAVRDGLQNTGRIITSAALLMVIVFGCFAAARMGNIEQIGLGLTVAVVIDATIVRCLLVPATMTLLGRWNWWPGVRWRDPLPPSRTADPGTAPVAPPPTPEPTGAAPPRSSR